MFVENDAMRTVSVNQNSKAVGGMVKQLQNKAPLMRGELPIQVIIHHSERPISHCSIFFTPSSNFCANIDYNGFKQVTHSE